MFVNTSLWEAGEKENSIRFFLLSPSDSCRIECNGIELKEGETPYYFPAGKIRVRVFQKGNFSVPNIDQCGFFPQAWRGIFLITKNEILTFPEQELTIFPEKGYFRIINLFERPLSVRRIGGREIFADIPAGEASSYRLAGAGEYRLQFFCQNQKVEEKDFRINEGSRGSLIVRKDTAVFLEEFHL